MAVTMATDYDPQEVGWGLVMPFVACKTQGGPYDDDGFCAGFQAGIVDGKLSAGIPEYRAAFYSPLAPQLDLIAMRHDYSIEVDMDPAYRDWSWVTFKRNGRDPDGS